MGKHPLADCANCPLAKEPMAPGFGAQTPKLVLVGEAPGYEEARQGKPFVGKSGQLLDAVLTAVGVSPAETYRTNAVLCRPPSNATPPRGAIVACRKRLQAELAEHPGVPIVALGATAAHELGVTDGITEARGRWHGRVLPTFHPAYILRQPNEARELFDDLAKSLRPKHNTPSFLPTIERNKYPQELETAPVIAYDVETGSPGLLCVNVAWGPDISQTAVLESDALVGLSFIRPDCVYVAHNGKYDQQALRSNGIPARLDFDTMLAHYAFDERSGGDAETEGEHKRGRHGLKTLAKYYCDAPDWGAAMSPYKKDYALAPMSVLAKYGTYDVYYTYHLYLLFKEVIEHEGLQDVMAVLMKCSEAALYMETKGLFVNQERARRLKEEWQKIVEDYKAEIVRLVGHEINPNSPQQLAALFYDELKFPEQKQEFGKNYKKNPRTTDRSARLSLMDKHPVMPVLDKYKRMRKLVTSYINPLLEQVGPDGRNHPSFAIHGTITGRWSSYYHTIPRADDHEEGKYGVQIRGLFDAEAGELLWACDLSQAEWRIGAAFSKDPMLLGIFERGEDPHGSVAREVFGPGAGKEERYAAKALNFGFMFGGRKKTLVNRLLEVRAGRPSLPADPGAIARIVDIYHEKMAVFIKWTEEQLALIKRQGYVTTATGRRARCYLITDDNFDDIRKKVMNSPIQGTAADITSLAAYELIQMGVDVRLTVHDSIIGVAPADKAKEVAQFAKQHLLTVAQRIVPGVVWDADAEVGQSWGSLEKVH